MYSSLLSPAERDADHPAHGHLFPAFAPMADAAPAHRHRIAWVGGFMLAAAASLALLLAR